MSETIRLRPAVPGAVIKDPRTGELLPEAGATVPADPYWIGLQLRGDVVPVEEKAVAKPSKPNVTKG